jgi:anti-sigma factor RsiW
MSDCRLVTEQLTSYVDEQLDATHRDEIEKHLDGCVSCRGAVARERGGQTVLRSMRSVFARSRSHRD